MLTFYVRLSQLWVPVWLLTTLPPQLLDDKAGGLAEDEEEAALLFPLCRVDTEEAADADGGPPVAGGEQQV